MKGHLIQRYPGSNSWSFVLELGKQVDPNTGKLKRKQKWVTVKGTKKEAEKQYIKLQHEIDTGVFVNPSKTTTEDYLRTWIKDYVWPSLAPRTAEGYDSIIEVHLIPALGKIPLNQLKPEHIQKYYSDKLKSERLNGEGLINPSTVRHHHAVIHHALKQAVKLGLIYHNPADAVDPPRGQQPEMHIMSESDVNRFLEAAKKTRFYSLFHMALYTGMRRSELLGLQWNDVDLLYCRVSVIRVLHQLKDGSLIFRQPKTAKGRRLIALSPSAVLVLKSHMEEQIAHKVALKSKLKGDDLVFCELDGKPILPDHVTQAWRRLANKLNLAGIHLHSARHTHATLMLKQGIHPKVVQERLGHASIQITLDTYSHVAPGIQEAAAKSFDELLECHKPEPSQKVVQEINKISS